MAAFRVIARLSCGTLPASGLAITNTDWMCLICADDWRAIRLHEECLVLWEDERLTRIPGST
jgi:hypothetical protein